MKLSTDDVFKIKSLFYEAHWNKSQIAREFHVDHTTIIYHLELKKLRKYKRKISVIKAPQLSQIELIASGALEHRNPGKNYKEYLKWERLKRLSTG